MPLPVLVKPPAAPVIAEDKVSTPLALLTEIVPLEDPSETVRLDEPVAPVNSSVPPLSATVLPEPSVPATPLSLTVATLKVPASTVVAPV